MSRYTEIIKNSHGSIVVYSIYDSQRINYNYTLLRALEYAQNNNMALEIIFPVELFDFYYEIQMNFIYQSLNLMQKKLSNFGLKITIVQNIQEYLKKDIHIIITDMPYILETKNFIKKYYTKNNLILVEGNVVVPIKVASQKEEFAAYTIRKKIMNNVSLYRHDFDVNLYNSLLKKNKIPFKPLFKTKNHLYFNGDEAFFKLEEFINSKEKNYTELRNNPNLNLTSNLSPYLNNGSISVLEILQNTTNDSFIEELVVRRELAYNFTFYNPNYYNLSLINIPNWVYEDMELHLLDPREFLYSIEDYIHLKTHDLYFNKCMEELIKTNKMHGYMRMYWGKKVIEWSDSYDEAFNNLVYLNNKFSLDGFNPNSYAGIAWCFAKHDRPFKSRAIFGRIRYMNSAGLERKFKMGDYLKKEF